MTLLVYFTVRNVDKRGHKVAFLFLLLKEAKTVTPNFALKKETNTIVGLLRLEFTGHFAYQNCIETTLNYVHFWA